MRGDDPAHEMRVLVTGGRDYANRNLVFRSLDRLAANHVTATKMDYIIVIHGACCLRGKSWELCGADRWADEWAKECEMPHISVPAMWAQYGNSAGPRRNQFMLDTFKPTNVLAFPGHSGTAHMVDIARKAGIIVWQPEEPTRRGLR